jgi:hypothetical protein
MEHDGTMPMKRMKIVFVILSAALVFLLVVLGCSRCPGRRTREDRGLTITLGPAEELAPDASR